VFYITAAVYSFGAVMYCILASGSIQPWAVESATLSASEVQVEVELNGVDTLRDAVKQNSTQNAAYENDGNDDATTDSLLQVD